MVEQSVSVRARIEAYLDKAELSSLLDAEEQAHATHVIIAAALVLKHAILGEIYDSTARARIMGKLQDVVDSALSSLGLHSFRASDVLQDREAG